MKKIGKKIISFILTLISRGILWRYNPRIIAVTGSVGKTSTKDAIYTILKNQGSVRKSEKSFNSDLGVPLSIIGAKNAWNNVFSWFSVIANGIWQIINPKGKYPKTLILEVGADRPGDISNIAKWLKPNIVVITRLPEVPVHIEFFPNLESVIEEKISLIKYMRKDGIMVLNADDKRIMKAKEKLHFRSFTFGENTDASIRVSNIKILPAKGDENGGLAYKIDFEEKSFPVNLPNIYAESYVTITLAALTVAHAHGLNMVTAINELRNYETPPGRVRLIAGIEDSILIDDTYNSSPAACEAGLQMLKDLPFGKRKIAIIGDMLELGKYTVDAHKEIGIKASEVADILITVGLRAKECANSAREAGMNPDDVYEMEDAISAGEIAKEKIEKGDVVFIKGSQGMRMERTVKMLMAEPERASELLVRQEDEWNNR